MREGHGGAALNGYHDDAQHAAVFEKIRLLVRPLHEERPVQAPVEWLQCFKPAHIDTRGVADEPDNVDETLSSEGEVSDFYYIGVAVTKQDPRMQDDDSIHNQWGLKFKLLDENIARSLPLTIRGISVFPLFHMCHKFL